ncbi:Putative cyclic nucleotide-gated ion channel [Arachis hypogaea]|nr:Putative cyclic nucleotide-gated ion channel [Arachis hypogaea]
MLIRSPHRRCYRPPFDVSLELRAGGSIHTSHKSNELLPLSINELLFLSVARASFTAAAAALVVRAPSAAALVASTPFVIVPWRCLLLVFVKLLQELQKLEEYRMNQKSIDSMVGLRTYMVSQSAAGLRQLHSRNHVKARPVKPLSTSNNICSSVVPLASQNWSAKMDHQEDCDLVGDFSKLFLIFPLNQHITKTTGVIAKTLWIAAAYNLLLYMLASHCEVTCKATLAKCHSKLFPNVTPRPSSTSSISLACLQMLFSMMLLLLTLWKDTSIVFGGD